MLRTEAEDVGEDALLISHEPVINKVARRLSPRCCCGSRGSTGLLSQALCFILFCSHKVFVPGYFFGFVHWLLLLFFGFDSAFEVDFGQFVGFISAIVIFVFTAQFVFIITAVIAYHSIFGICANHVSSTL